MGATFSNLFSRLWWKREKVKIFIYGLDAAGKTTILYKFKLGENITTIPTIGFNVETVEYRNISLTMWDVGGGNMIRPLLRYYFPGTNAIILVVDSADRERIEQPKEEVDRLIIDEEFEEQDLANAMSVEEVSEKLGFDKLISPHRKWHIQAASAVQGHGLYEGLDWLANELNK